METKRKEEIICKYVDWVNNIVEQNLMIGSPFRKNTFWMWLTYNFKEEEKNLDELFTFLCNTCVPAVPDNIGATNEFGEGCDPWID